MTSNFFRSEMVKGDLQEMAELQRFCFQSMTAFPILNKERRLEYFNVLEQLIEKQKIFYTRLKLSDDPEALEFVESMKRTVELNASMLGANYSENVSELFDTLINRIQKMKNALEAEQA